MTSQERPRFVFLVVTLLALTALLMVVTLSVASGQTKDAADAATAPAGDAANGKKIYASYGCYECHGYEGQGATRTSAPRIAPDPIAFGLFRYIVREPPDSMPPYTEKVVSDEELADIYAFLQSVPQPPDVKSIPELQ
jgi:mono/diheme cytochrome c family protein